MMLPKMPKDTRAQDKATRNHSGRCTCVGYQFLRYFEGWYFKFCENQEFETNAEVKYQLVAEEEADLASEISVKSPIGKGLLGKKKGDLAVMNVPAGEVKFKILEISYD